MKKKLFSLLLVLSVLLALSAAVWAEPDGFVFDPEGKLPESELHELQTLGENIYNDTGVAVCVLITSDTGEDINAFTEEFYKSRIGAENGALLVHNDSPEKNTITMYVCGEKISALDSELLVKAPNAYTDADSYSEGVRSYMNYMLALLGGQTAFGDVTPEDNPNIPTDRVYDRVADFAGVISESELKSLNELADTVSEQYACDVAVVFVSSLDGKDVVSFADDFYDYNGYGYGYGDDGILLLISVGDREYATSTYGTGRTIFPSYRISSEIEPGMLSYLKRSDWAGAAQSFIYSSSEVLEAYASGAYDQNQQNEWRPGDTERATPKITPIGAAISAIIGFFTGGIPAGSMKRQLKSVQKKYGAANYSREGLRLNRSDDYFLYMNVSKTPIPRDTDRDHSSSGHSSHSSGGSVHFSSSGRSHGGTHGKF